MSSNGPTPCTASGGTPDTPESSQTFSTSSSRPATSRPLRCLSSPSMRILPRMTRSVQSNPLNGPPNNELIRIHRVWWAWDSHCGTISKYWDMLVCMFVCMSVCVYVGHWYRKFGLSHAHHIACIGSKLVQQHGGLLSNNCQIMVQSGYGSIFARQNSRNIGRIGLYVLNFIFIGIKQLS